MAILYWGKPKIQVSKLNASGDPTNWIDVPTPALDTTQMDVQEGETVEAKIEGGEVEASRKAPNSYTLKFDIRATDNRADFVEDVDGVIEGEYALRLQPENPTLKGIVMDTCVLSVTEKFSTKDGLIRSYTAKALKPKAGRMVKHQKINPKATNSLIVILSGEDGKGRWRVQGEDNWRMSGETAHIEGAGAKTIEFSTVASKTLPTPNTVTIAAGMNVHHAKYT